MYMYGSQPTIQFVNVQQIFVVAFEFSGAAGSFKMNFFCGPPCQKVWTAQALIDVVKQAMIKAKDLRPIFCGTWTVTIKDLDSDSKPLDLNLTH